MTHRQVLKAAVVAGPWIGAGLMVWRQATLERQLTAWVAATNGAMDLAARQLAGNATEMIRELAAERGHVT